MAEAQGIKQISFVDAVDRASEAVVGVINIQRDNFSEQIQRPVQDQE